MDTTDILMAPTTRAPRGYDWKFFFALGTPLVATAMAFATLQSSATAHEKAIEELKLEMREIASLKERSSILETKFGTIDARLERMERLLERLAGRNGDRETRR